MTGWVQVPEPSQTSLVHGLPSEVQGLPAGLKHVPAVSLHAPLLQSGPAGHGLPHLRDYIAFGASPRGPISLVQSSRALALVRGRDYVLVDDLQALAKDAMRHRLVLTYQALAEEVSPERILDAVISAVPVPQVDLARSTAA